MRSIPPFLVALLLAHLSAQQGIAGEGVLELSQVCAVQTGCVPGDAPGFPITIAAAGSHRLTSDLHVPDVNTTAVQVTSPHVHLDLNGFNIQCVGCIGTGTGVGIDADASSNGLTIRNGSIQRVGSSGIRIQASQGKVQHVSIVDVGGAGILHNGFDARIEDCSIIRVGGDGISLGMWGIVARNHLRSASNHGIVIQDGRVTDNVLSSSGLDGILGFNAVVSGNRVSASGGDGIDCSGCTVRGNDVSGNSGLGLAGSLLGTPSAYGGNRFDGNNGGNANPQVSGTAIEISGNVCGGDVTCP